MRINVYIMIYVINILFLYFQNFYNCIEKLKVLAPSTETSPLSDGEIRTYLKKKYTKIRHIMNIILLDFPEDNIQWKW